MKGNVTSFDRESLILLYQTETPCNVLCYRLCFVLCVMFCVM